MKLGTYTFQPGKAKGFDFNVLRVKVETGVRLQPVEDMYSNIAVFADNVAARNHPDWVSQSPRLRRWEITTLTFIGTLFALRNLNIEQKNQTIWQRLTGNRRESG